MLQPDEISRLYSERIFDITGATPQRRKIICPLPRHTHHNYTPSFSIFWVDGRWRWRCHGSCNLQGDVIDLVGYMNLPNYDPHDNGSIKRAIAILTTEKDGARLHSVAGLDLPVYCLKIRCTFHDQSVLEQLLDG